MNKKIFLTVQYVIFGLLMSILFSYTTQANNGTSTSITWGALDPALGHGTGQADSSGWSATAGQDREGFLSYGPYVSLAAGEWTVTWTLKIDNNTADNQNVARLEVYDANTSNIVAFDSISRNEFNQANQFQDFNLNFNNLSGDQRLEFRVYWYGNSAIQLKEINVNKISNLSYIQSWKPHQLGHNVGRMGNTGWSANTAQDQPGFLSYGPYVGDLTSGRWIVTWNLHIDNNTADNEKVARLEVIDADADWRSLATTEVTRREFMSAYDPQDFKLDFEFKNPGHRLEFRVFWYGTSQLELRKIWVHNKVEVEQQLTWNANDPALGHIVGRKDNENWSANTTQDREGMLLFGPYVKLSSGIWTANWTAKIDNNVADNEKVIQLVVMDADTGNLLAYQNISRRQFIKANQFQDFSVQFANFNPSHRLEFKVYWYGNAYIQVKDVSVTNEANTRYAKSWGMHALAHSIGRMQGNSWFANPSQDQPGHLSFGPYTTELSPGKWTASWNLTVDNNTINNDKIAALDVIDIDSGKILATKDIVRNEFALANNPQMFELDFLYGNPGHRLEFRVYWYGTSTLGLQEIRVHNYKYIDKKKSWSATDPALGHNIGRQDHSGWSANTTQDREGHLVFGPYVKLEQGKWNASWQLMIDNNSAGNGNVARIEVFDTETSNILGYKYITRQQFAKAYEYQEFSVDFTNFNPDHRLEFRLYWLGSAYIQFKEVNVSKKSTINYSKSWEVQILGHNVGRMGEHGWSANVNQDQPGFLSFGPYESGLSPLGQWTATWNLRLADSNAAQDEKIARLEAFDVDANVILASRDITNGQFMSPYDPQDFHLNFITENKDRRLEFRVYWYGKSGLELRNLRLMSTKDNSTMKQYQYDLNGNLIKTNEL